MSDTPTPRGRGSGTTPPNRFQPTYATADHTDADPSADPQADPPADPATRFLPDHAASILSRNDSPDIPFDYSLNPYRGCEHGCAYCYARPTHEYLGFNAGIEFETRIMVKHDAPRLLENTLGSPRWNPAPVMMSGVTDCYQPVERKEQLSRHCLTVLARYRNPVGIVTKNALVARDLDLLRDMAAWRGCSVSLTMTTLDPDLSRRMEPRAASPRQRLETIGKLADAGVRTGVMVAPVIPGLNDAEIPDILEAAARAGAGHAGRVLLRLPRTVEPVFLDWLERAVPSKKERILARLRELRGGELNDPRFGSRFRGSGIWADTYRQMFELGMRRAGLDRESHFALNTGAFRRPGGTQLTLL